MRLARSNMLRRIRVVTPQPAAKEASMPKVQLITDSTNKLLTTISAPVFAHEHKYARSLAERMFEDVGQKHVCFGVSAVQVGVLKRMFIMDLAEERLPAVGVLPPHAPSQTPQRRMVAVINPRIREVSTTQALAVESCLSTPGTFCLVSRPDNVLVDFYDLDWKRRRLTLSGWDARVFLHEFDHLNGVLILSQDRTQYYEKAAQMTGALSEDHIKGIKELLANRDWAVQQYKEGKLNMPAVG